jgi:hypothetical protein
MNNATPDTRTLASLHILLNAAQEKLTALLLCKTPPDECDLAVMLNFDFTGTVYNLASSQDVVLFEFDTLDQLFEKLLSYANIYS